jgi:predicted O-linked N-acetylglucosamine transferase (SPINDLY family)
VTTLDALAVGVPVLTLAGEAHASRTGASILAAMAMTELVVESAEAYEAMAWTLATNAALLGALKARLADAGETPPLYRPERLARHLERAFETMWRHWFEGLAPKSFHVPAID